MRIILQIDCDPMNRHQEELGRHIFNSVLKKEYREPNNTFFGCWAWCGVECDDAQQEAIKNILVDAYNNNEVRYCSWGEE